MKLERVTVSDRKLQVVRKESGGYRRGYLDGYVQGRDQQLKADRKAVSNPT